MNKWTVVIPTVREEKFAQFLGAWSPLFEKHNVNLVVVQDNNDEWNNRPEELPYSFYWFTHKDIDEALQDRSWIIPRKTDCVRSFGFLIANKLETEFVLTLDDDVLPIPGIDIFQEYEKVFNDGAIVSSYYNVGEFINNYNDIFMRGFPFGDRKKQKVMLQYGMWAGVPDLDGITQLAQPISDAKVTGRVQVIPRGVAVTGCIMNCAFRREFIPHFYQLLMGQDHKFDRWGDIWSGLIAKRVCDYNSWAVVLNGNATIEHRRASDVTANIKKEASGYSVNEQIWEMIPIAKTGREAVEYMGRTDAFYDKDYSEKIVKAYNIWSEATR